MNEKDKRKLSEAEQRRLEKYERLSEDLIRQGYTRTELIVDIKKANVFAIVLLIPLFTNMRKLGLLYTPLSW